MEAQLPGIPEDHGWLRTYRTTDGGLTWQPVAAGSTTPSYSSSWLTADGRIVVVVPVWKAGEGIPTAYVHAVSTDGGRTYAPATLPGLPAEAREANGSTAFTEDDVYISDDGWTWRKA